jgi:hypothetical protein
VSNGVPVPEPQAEIPYETNGVPQASEYDPFDPVNLHRPAGFQAALGVRKILSEVPCRKPLKEWWFTVSPEAEHHVETYLIELKEERGALYYVSPLLWDYLQNEPTLTYQRLSLCQTRQGKSFFWPLKLPGPDGKLNEWAQSAHDAALRGRGTWIRLQADMHLGQYQLYAADLPVEVVWPPHTMKELLRICFKERLIDRLDHPIVRQLLHCEL